MQLDRLLARRRDVHRVVLLERAGVDPHEAQLVHERIDARLEDLRHERPARVGLHLDLVAVVLRRAVRRSRSAGKAQSASASSSSSTPTPVLAETQTIGINVPAGDRFDDQPREFFLASAALPSK